MDRHRCRPSQAARAQPTPCNRAAKTATPVLPPLPFLETSTRHLYSAGDPGALPEPAAGADGRAVAAPTGILTFFLSRCRLLPPSGPAAGASSKSLHVPMPFFSFSASDCMASPSLSPAPAAARQRAGPCSQRHQRHRRLRDTLRFLTPSPAPSSSGPTHTHFVPQRRRSAAAIAAPRQAPVRRQACLPRCSAAAQRQHRQHAGTRACMTVRRQHDGP